MGFGVSGLINKYMRPALIKYINPEMADVFKKYYGVNTVPELYERVNFITAWAGTNNITPDVKKSETHSYQSNVTQMTLEDGNIAAEHIIQQPISVSLQFEETNNTIASGLGFAKGLFGPKKTFDQLVEIWKKKAICQIITEHEIYNNMVIQNMPIQHRAPYRNSIAVTCEFTQLSFTTPAMSVYIGKNAGLSLSVSKTISGGQQMMSLS